MSDDDLSHRGVRCVDWLWVCTIAVGLAIMIAIPLTGR
jgi:hypothetical protein